MYFLIFILLELISLRILIAPLPPRVLEYNSYESKHLNSSKDLQTLSKCLHSSWASYFYIVWEYFSGPRDPILGICLYSMGLQRVTHD